MDVSTEMKLAWRDEEIERLRAENAALQKRIDDLAAERAWWMDELTTARERIEELESQCIGHSCPLGGWKKVSDE